MKSAPSVSLTLVTDERSNPRCVASGYALLG
jgi:hypothetical protein